MISEKEIFLRISHYKSIGANDPQVVASLGPKDLIDRIYVGDHYTLLHTRYISAIGLMIPEKKIFKVFPIISLWELYMGMAAI